MDDREDGARCEEVIRNYALGIEKDFFREVTLDMLREFVMISEGPIRNPVRKFRGFPGGLFALFLFLTHAPIIVDRGGAFFKVKCIIPIVKPYSNSTLCPVSFRIRLRTFRNVS